ncbi:AAA family ATPase [Rhodocyclus tenuis]|uniref:Putative kinase n=1 Tax=Rhodocyclus tenuis TaxID=1066 RepID=A0A840GB86_RHOTE|nr:AAA family ATPase [Rhodocyclus tenuis]MBB4249106.1 putative kinase [Rhodocyclus tenuis]
MSSVLETEQQRPSRPEAVILCGVQGAGKRSFCREYYWDSHIRINYDMLRTRHREGLLLSACLDARQALVVDATNPTAADRARYIEPCRRAGFRVVGVEFRIDTELARLRNAARSGRARVPDKAIFATAGKLEPLAFSEGFDEIWWVLSGVDGFRVFAARPHSGEPQTGPEMGEACAGVTPRVSRRAGKLSGSAERQ